jgi:phosphatidate cytidylyltransferase
MIPWISPNKTWEGAVGGVVAGMIVGGLTWWLAPQVRHVFGGAERGSLVYLLVFAAVMSVLGQLSDLLESLFKRSAGAKDSAALIPTFGGVLDVVDALLLTGPVAWMLLSYWSPAS